MWTALFVLAVSLGFCAYASSDIGSYLPFYHAKSKIESYFAMCLIIRDAGEDLPEWIEYHHRMGASKFYIFDHNSTVPVINYIRDYVLSGLVDLQFTDFRNIKDARPPQIVTYDKCVHDYGSRHRFMGFIDSDEFIVVVDKNRTIPDVLKRYEKYGGLALNWMLFGSSGHTEKPPGGVIANYYRCRRNKHLKHIGNTQYVAGSSGNPHYLKYKPNYYAVSSNGTRSTGIWNTELRTAFDTIYINHYNTKSKAEFLAKIARGRGAMRNTPEARSKHFYKVDYLSNLDNATTDVCPVLEMPPPLRVKI
jgi:hypothetical protein